MEYNIGREDTPAYVIMYLEYKSQIDVLTINNIYKIFYLIQ